MSVLKPLFTATTLAISSIGATGSNVGEGVQSPIEHTSIGVYQDKTVSHDISKVFVSGGLDSSTISLDCSPISTGDSIVLDQIFNVFNTKKEGRELKKSYLENKDFILKLKKEIKKSLNSYLEVSKNRRAELELIDNVGEDVFLDKMSEIVMLILEDPDKYGIVFDSEGNFLIGKGDRLNETFYYKLFEKFFSEVLDYEFGEGLCVGVLAGLGMGFCIAVFLDLKKRREEEKKRIKKQVENEFRRLVEDKNMEQIIEKVGEEKFRSQMVKIYTEINRHPSKYGVFDNEGNFNTIMNGEFLCKDAILELYKNYMPEYYDWVMKNGII